MSEFPSSPSRRARWRRNCSDSYATSAFLPRCPSFHVWVGGRFYGRLDAAYPDEKVGLEYQSYERHAGKLAVDNDNARRRRFKAIDWDIVEVTGADFRDRGLLLAPTLWRALRRAA